MRDANAVGRLQLKSKLLIGVAGLAAAGSSAAMAADPAAPPSDPKWAPYADIGGGVGDSFTQGRVTLFAPVWQDLDSLLFVRVGAGTQTHNDEMFNIGAGYRTKIDPEWILGLFAGFDNTHTDAGHNFSRLSLGAELMSADWDARINAYSAKHDPQILPSAFELVIQDTHIGILQAQEAAYSGFDGEIGYRVFHTDNTDVRLFAGGFIFQNTHHVITPGVGTDFDFKYPSMSGPRGRAEVNIFDLDVLGSQSRVSFDGEISHDKIRGTTGFAGATLRIPLGAVSGQGAQMLDDLDRRMADPVRRSDDVMTALQFNKPEPVIIYNGTITSEPTNTLYYVDNSLGHGSYADPTTLKDATDRGPVNQFVVLTDQEGPVDATGTHVQSGESVVGPGVFQVRGVDSGRVFTHDFAPGSGPVSITSSDPNVITLDPNTNLFGLTIQGPFTNAIYGHNINDVVIGNVTIDGNGTGENGIYIVQDNGSSANVNIYNTTIENVTNDGVAVDITNDTGGASSFNLMLTDMDIDAGHDGVGVHSDTTGGSTSTVYAGVHDSTITGGASDVIMIGTSSAGSTLHQTLVVDPTILNAGDYGILVGGYSDGGTLTQDVLISDVTINDVTNSGIYIYAYGVDGATITQNVTMNNVTVHGNFSKDEGGGDALAPNAAAVEIGGYAYGNLITLGAASKFDATVTQTFNLTNVTANEAYYDNIRIEAYAGYGGVTHQYGTLSNVTANDAIYGNGISLVAYAANSGHVIQRATLSDVTTNNNKYDGIDVRGRARIITEAGIQAQFTEQEVGSTLAAQYIQIHNANAVGNFAGLDASVSARGDAAALQQLSVTGSTFDSNEYGVEAGVYASNGGSAQQLVSLTGSTARYNSEDGVAFGAVSYAEGFAAQTVYIDHLTATYNDGDGAHFAATASYGGNSEQNVYLYDSTLSHNSGNGLAIRSAVNGYDYGQVEGTYYYSHVSQNVIAAYDDASHNDHAGVNIANSVSYGGQLNQFIYLYADTMNGNGDDGVRENTTVNTTGYYEGEFGLPTAAYADLYVVDSVTNFNGEAGIHITSSLIAPLNPEQVLGYSYLVQNIVVSGTQANSNDGDGFSDSVSDTGLLTFSAHYVTISDNSAFDHNGADGAFFNAYQNFGPGSFGAATQVVSISDSDFSRNQGSGLAGIAEATGFQGRAQQNFTIQDSTFDHNHGDGIYLSRFAHDGVYYSATYNENTYAYPCTGLQGVVGGCAFVRQTVQISGSDVSSNIGDGIYVKSVAENYGAIYTGLAVDDNGNTYRAHTPTLLVLGSTVDGNGGDGLDVQSDVGLGSYLYQYVVGAYSSFDGNRGDGIYIGNHVHDGGFVGQYRTVSYEGEEGTYTYTYLYAGSKLTLYNASASNNLHDGIELYNDVIGRNRCLCVANAASEVRPLYQNPSLLYQYVAIVNSQVDGNRGLGIEANNYVTGGSQFIQTILLYTYAPEEGGATDFAGTSVNGNHHGGVAVYTFSDGNYSFDSLAVNNFIALGADVSDNGGDGVYMGMNSYVTYAAVQSFLAAGSSFTGNDGVGVGLLTFGNSDYYNNQNVRSLGNLFAGNTDIGLGAGMIDVNAEYASQSLTSLGDSFIQNAGGGLVQYAGFIDTYYGEQDSTIVNGTFSGNGTAVIPALGVSAAAYHDIPRGNGIFVGMVATGEFTSAYTSQYIVGNHVYDSARDGIRVAVSAGYGAYVYDSTVIGGNTIEYSGHDGINVSLNAYDDGVILSAVPLYEGGGIVIADNTVEHVGTSYEGPPPPASINGAEFLIGGGNGIEVSLNAYNGGVIAGYYQYSVPPPAGISGASEAPKYYGYTPFVTLIDGNTVNDTANDGIAFSTSNYGGGIFAVTGIGYYEANNVSNAGGYGISVANNNNFGVTVSAAGVLNNMVSDAYVGGISVNNRTEYGITASLNAIEANTVSGTTQYAGINIVDYGRSGTAYDYSYVGYNTVSDNTTGIGLYTYGDNSVEQDTAIKYNTLSYNETGIAGYAAGTTSQQIDVYENGNTQTHTATYYDFAFAAGASQSVF